MVEHLDADALAAYGDTAVDSAPTDAVESAEPAGETSAVETPDTEAGVEAPAEPSAPEVPAGPDWNARIQEWGGEERISDALAIAEALGSDEGVEALIREGYQVLGLDPDKAFALAKGEELPDPDALMTRAEFEAEMKKQSQTFAEMEQKQQEAVAFSAVETVLENLGVHEDEDARRMVLTYAQAHVSGPEELDPRKLMAAVEQGYKDYESAMERAAQKYLEDRKKKNDSVPKTLKGGGAPNNEEAAPEKPKNLEEARAAARRAMPGAFARE